MRISFMFGRASILTIMTADFVDFGGRMRRHIDRTFHGGVPGEGHFETAEHLRSGGGWLGIDKQSLVAQLFARHFKGRGNTAGEISFGLHITESLPMN